MSANTLGASLDVLVASLQVQYPARVVTRSFKSFDVHNIADMQAGVYTLILDRCFDYLSNPLRGGREDFVITGQILLADGSTGQQVEDAEIGMLAELEAWMRSEPACCSMKLRKVSFSHQQYQPRGWIIAEFRRLSE